MRRDRGLISLSWIMDPIFQVTEPISEEAKARALKPYEILYDKRNWSRLLNPNRLTQPPVIPSPTGSIQEGVALLSDTDREEVDVEAKRG